MLKWSECAGWLLRDRRHRCRPFVRGWERPYGRLRQRRIAGIDRVQGGKLRILQHRRRRLIGGRGDRLRAYFMGWT